MNYARIEYEQTNTGNRTFSVPFPYISQDDIVISVDGTEVTYEWLNSATVRLDEAPEVGAIVGVYRETEREELLVDYKDGSTLTESDLDLAALQTFFIAQEAFDQTGSSLDVANDGSYSATGRRISNLADPVNDQDAATKAWVAAQYNSGVDAGEALEATEEARDIAVDAATSASEDLAATQTLHDEAEEARDTAVSSAATATSAAETSTSNLEDFLGQYWGAYASEPTLDPNGEAPSGGDLYYNTTTETLRIFNETGSYWKDVGSNAEGMLFREDYTATEGQTTFSIQYDAPYVIVSVNGYTLPTSDYTATDGSTIVLNEGVPVDTEVSLLGFSAISFGSLYTKDEVDNLFDGYYTKEQMVTLIVDLVDNVNESIGIIDQKIDTQHEKYMIVASNYTPVGDEGDFTLITDANLPDNIVANTRYVLTNPFGSTVPCEVVCQLQIGGVWTVVGRSAVGSVIDYYGSLAGYVPSVGIVIQTAKDFVSHESPAVAGLHLTGSAGTNAITSAPCRLLVKRF